MDIGKIAQAASNTEAVSLPNLVVQLDADFYAYRYAWTDESVEENCRKVKESILKLKRKLGAHRINVHVTQGLKSGRELVASVKEYQGNRKPNPKQERVELIRNYLANLENAGIDGLKVVRSVVREADDAMGILQCRELENSCIVSSDKDLWMIPGFHFDAETETIVHTDSFGWLRDGETPSGQSKLIGKGSKWFWAQMLMGDRADNIPGLPKLSGRILDLYFPLKSKQKAPRKAGACGEGKVRTLLDGAKNDKAAFTIVYDCYKDWYGLDTDEMFIEQAILLWIHRSPRFDDVCHFLGDNCDYGVELPKRLKEAQDKYIQQAKKMQEYMKCGS